MYLFFYYYYYFKFLVCKTKEKVLIQKIRYLEKQNKLLRLKNAKLTEEMEHIHKKINAFLCKN